MAGPTDPDELALLAAIIAAPDEDAVRLAYADWLDERDQCSRASYIRWRILGPSALAPRGSVNELLSAMAQAEEDAISAFAGWAGPELAAFFCNRDDYERGLLSRVNVGHHFGIGMAGLLSGCDRLFKLAPVRHVRIYTASPKELCDLASRPEVARLTTLTLGEECWRSEQEQVIDALVCSSHLDSLRSLTVRSTREVFASMDRDDPQSIDQLTPEQWLKLEKRFAFRLSR